MNGIGKMNVGFLLQVVPLEGFFWCYQPFLGFVIPVYSIAFSPAI
jgi:hypothetical protein